MLIGYLIDLFCNIILWGLAVAFAAFLVSVVVIMVGEKMKWW